MRATINATGPVVTLCWLDADCPSPCWGLVDHGDGTESLQLRWRAGWRVVGFSAPIEDVVQWAAEQGLRIWREITPEGERVI